MGGALPCYDSLGDFAQIKPFWGASAYLDFGAPLGMVYVVYLLILCPASVVRVCSMCIHVLKM